jgi:hypothetical protein
MQKVPHKKKTIKKSLDTNEKRAREEFYQEMMKFYDNNEIIDNSENRKVYTAKYMLELENVRINQLIQYLVEDYDNNKFESFGMIVDKELYLTEEEFFYLNQIGLVRSERLNESISISKIFAYGYLRRAGKLILW